MSALGMCLIFTSRFCDCKGGGAERKATQGRVVGEDAEPGHCIGNAAGRSSNLTTALHRYEQRGGWKLHCGEAYLSRNLYHVHVVIQEVQADAAGQVSRGRSIGPLADATCVDKNLA
eukprot:scaffold434_cov186-Pinguiococcus_pyrenoidosus.AAC.86